MKIEIFECAYGNVILTIEYHDKTYKECCELGEKLMRTGLFEDCDYEVEEEEN